MIFRSLFIACLLCVSGYSQAKWYEQSQSIMGTNIFVQVWADSDEDGERAIHLVMTEMERINQLMSPYLANSALSKINRLAAKQGVRVSREMFDLLTLSVGLSQETEGAFDITFASVGFLYNYREKRKPSEQQIAGLLAAIDYRHIQLDRAEQSVRFSHQDVKIDLGGIAKGHAVDNALALLKAQGIESALITAGGDTGIIGDRRGRPWMVGIRDPRDRDRQAVVLPLQNTAMSTSGDYERYFESDGKRYHHILSPKEGTSAHEVQSVTIIGPRSTLNDGLSTAVFVLGVKKGIDLINKTRGYEAIIMDNQRKMHHSRGFESLQGDD